MPAYNMTALKEVNSVGDIFVYANNVTQVGSAGGLLFGMLVVAFFIIMLFVLKKWEFDKSILASSFACFVLSLILSYAKLVNFIFPLLFAIIMALTGFWMYRSSQ